MIFSVRTPVLCTASILIYFGVELKWFLCSKMASTIPFPVSTGSEGYQMLNIFNTFFTTLDLTESEPTCWLRPNAVNVSFDSVPFVLKIVKGWDF